jgi:iduronate 2-sulfatase
MQAMNRQRIGYKEFVVLYLALSGILAGTTPERVSKAKPNVLFIVVDDLRPDLGCYGNTLVSSPNINQLAAQGVVFKRSYCNVSVCGASRASLLTGIRPADYRFLDYESRADKDFSIGITLPALFRQNGYYTISLGKVFHFQEDSKVAWRENWRPNGQSARDYLASENIAIDKGNKLGPAYEKVDVPDSAYRDGKTALKAIEYLQKFGKTNEPFFLAVGFLKPHLPFNAPKKYWDLYKPEKIGLAPAPAPPQNAPQEAFHPWKELKTYHGMPQEGPMPDDTALTLRHAYYACISYIDAQIGLLLSELSKAGLAENTIVVLLGDHGWNLGDNAIWGKHCQFNRSLHTPLIMRAPGLIKGTINASITEFIDIYPTLADLCHLADRPGRLDGQSLLERLKKPNRTANDYAISKFGNGVTLIKGPYFYSEWYDKQDLVLASMLYDHRTDPEETVNLSVKPQYAGLVKALGRELREKRGRDFFSNTGGTNKNE